MGVDIITGIVVIGDMGTGASKSYAPSNRVSVGLEEKVVIDFSLPPVIFLNKSAQTETQ
jgi:hypothetical protein